MVVTLKPVRCLHGHRLTQMIDLNTHHLNSSASDVSSSVSPNPENQHLGERAKAEEFLWGMVFHNAASSVRLTAEE